MGMSEVQDLPAPFRIDQTTSDNFRRWCGLSVDQFGEAERPTFITGPWMPGDPDYVAVKGTGHLFRVLSSVQPDGRTLCYCDAIVPVL